MTNETLKYLGLYSISQLRLPILMLQFSDAIKNLDTPRFSYMAFSFLVWENGCYQNGDISETPGFVSNCTSIPSSFFKQVLMAVLIYILAKHCPRLRYDILISCKRDGGRGFPNLKLYYKASLLLTHILDCYYKEGHKLWVTDEQCISHSLPFSFS